MMLRTIPLAVLAALLGACAVSPVNVDQSVKPATERGAFFTTRAQLEEKGIKYVKDEKKVAIPTFRVVFMTDKKASEKAYGTSHTGEATVAMNARLEGVDNAVFQRITDAIYADFQQKLRAAGFEVVDYATLSRYTAFAEMNVKPANPDVQGGARIFAPTGTRLAVPSTGLGAASGKDPARAAGLLAREARHAALDVEYRVDFLAASTSGGGWFSTRADIDIAQVAHVLPGSGAKFHGYRATQCVGYCPDTVTSVAFGQALVAEGEFGTLSDVTENAGMQRALNVVSRLTVGSVMNFRNYKLDADAARYEALTTKLLRDANAQVTDSLGKAL